MSSNRYNKIVLPDGTTKRISKKITQTGGTRSEEAIDRDFDSEQPRMTAIYSPEKGWLKSHESWYDLLNIPPDYLITKCNKKNRVKPETQQAIRNWANRLHRLTDNPTGLARKLMHEDKKNPSADVGPYETYLNTTLKQDEKIAYQECNLSRKETSLTRDNKIRCQDLLNNPIPYDAPITNDIDFQTALNTSGMREETKQQITSCYNAGYRATEKGYPLFFEYTNFKHLQNIGSGDCLFIAFAHYLYIVDSLGGAIPNPLEDNTGLPDPKFLQMYGQQSVLTAQAHTLRNRVVKWLRDNMDNDNISGLSMTIKHDLAILALESTNIHSMATKYSILKEFIKQYPTEAQILGISTITPPKAITKLLSIFSDEDNFPNDTVLDLIETTLANTYLDSMSERSTYGGQPEITALAHLYNVDIAVLQEKDETLEYNSGYVYMPDPKGVIYLFHNQSVRGRGSLHYEIMFPLPKDRFVQSVIKRSSPAPSPYTTKKLMSLTGDELLNTVNKLFVNKLEHLDSLPTLQKKSMYDLIEYSLSVLDIEHRKNIVSILPILSMRNIPESEIAELWQEEHLQDTRLQKIFKSYVDSHFIKEIKHTQQLIKTLPVAFSSLDIVGDRMRMVLSTFLLVNGKPCEPEDLISMTMEEIYDMLSSLTDTEENTLIRSFFITEFMEHYYYNIIPLYSVLNPDKPIVIPGVNAKADIKTIYDLIQDLSEVIGFDLV
jgi:hypothetical protein